MNRVVNAQIYVLKFQSRIELRGQRFVRQKSFADQVVRLGRFLEVGIAVAIEDDLAATGTGEVNLDAAFGKVPVGMSNFRKPERRFGIGDDEQYFHRSSSVRLCNFRRPSPDTVRKFGRLLLQLFLVDDVGDPVRKHAIGGGEYVERFPKQHDLSVGRRAVTEESLMNVLSGN